MRIERHEPFRLELPECLADWNPADAKLDTDGILAQRLALWVPSAQNSLADGVGGHARQRLSPNRKQLEVSVHGRQGRVGSIHRNSLATGHGQLPRGVFTELSSA